MSIAVGLYQHFKGAYYKVMDVAKHSETQEEMVVYRALYGDKSVWVRPLSMFAETVQRDGVVKPRFTYLDLQTEVLELAVLDVNSGQEHQFEAAFLKAEAILRSLEGYVSHDLQRCVENSGRYLLLVNWHSHEHHTVEFGQSSEYQQWKKSLRHFYQSFPSVEHFQTL